MALNVEPEWKTWQECWDEAAKLGMDMSQVFIESRFRNGIWHVISKRQAFQLKDYDESCMGFESNLCLPSGIWTNQPEYFSGFALLKPFSKLVQHSQVKNNGACQCNRADYKHNAGCGYMLNKYGSDWRPYER